MRADAHPIHLSHGPLTIIASNTVHRGLPLCLVSSPEHPTSSAFPRMRTRKGGVDRPLARTEDHGGGKWCLRRICSPPAIGADAFSVLTCPRWGRENGTWDASRSHWGSPLNRPVIPIDSVAAGRRSIHVLSIRGVTWGGQTGFHQIFTGSVSLLCTYLHLSAMSKLVAVFPVSLLLSHLGPRRPCLFRVDQHLHFFKQHITPFHLLNRPVHPSIAPVFGLRPATISVTYALSPNDIHIVTGLFRDAAALVPASGHHKVAPLAILAPYCVLPPNPRLLDDSPTTETYYISAEPCPPRRWHDVLSSLYWV
ncbi:hypothetical protein F5X68DRAFT_50242 [Plectosphaerella plurivora]|uniref:Uncharacterized protein n=1 Tax=Plectosphaerella plurivora TaxID=936078 RepID=A0A9P9A7E6_9PEZI|nr:hypothetical protein F5X68DRAFT_50242 [Plectosphaerella plurivora]